MMNSFRSGGPRLAKVRMALLCASVACCAAPAFAQDAAGADEAADETEIVVTATGRSQTALSVPYNVSAISEDQLREENIVDIKDLIAQSPSINAPLNGARFADSVTVRGLNVSPVNANNIEQFARSTIAYYLDDTPLPNLAYRIKDIERVETLLGPQGTLYGAGSLGGTVRFITNKPDFSKASARISTSIFAAKGGGLSHDTDAVVNLPIGDKLALRFAVARLDDEGYVDRVSNPSWRAGALAWSTIPDPTRNLYKNDDYNRVTSGRVSAAWQISDGLKLTLAHAQQSQLAHGTSGTSLLPLAVANARNQADIDAYVRDPDGPSCPVATCQFTQRFNTPFLAGQDTIVSRYPEFARRKFRLSSADIDVDLGFADLHSSTSIFKDTRIGQADYASQGYVFYFSFGDAGGAFDSGRSAFITFDNSFKGLNHETRLTSKGDGPLSWIAGIYYADTERSLKFSEILPGLDAYNGINRTVSGGNLDEGYRENLASEYNELAIYGELTYAITPAWKATVGGRLFNYKDRAISQIRDYSFDLVNNNVDVTIKDKGKSYFKFNTSYNFTDNALIYATVSQGFRRGGTNGFRNVGPLIVKPEIQAYKPDSTINYEVGIKGKFFDDKLAVTANLYQIDWKDVQTYYSQEINFFPVNGTTNGPKARARGFESVLSYKVTDGLDVRFSTAYTESEWAATKEVCLYTTGTIGCRTYAKGGKLGGSPKWKHSGSIKYTNEFSDNASGWISLSGRYVGSIQSDRADDPLDIVASYPSYALFDARVGGKWNALDVSLFVENIANKRARVSQQADRILGDRILFTNPRTMGVNLSYKF